MKIAEYFIKALNAGMYYKKEWVLEFFGYVEYAVEGRDKTPEYRVFTQAPGEQVLYTIINGEVHKLDDYKPNQPLAGLREKLELKPGDLVNVKEPITTTYGNAFINSQIFIYPFGNKVDFITGRIDTGKFERLLADNLHDTPKEGETRRDDVFYVDEYLKYGEAMATLEGYSMLCVQAASPNTMLPNPAVIKRRNELLAEHKDELDDPAVIAKIQMELVKVDKETMSDDISKDFYVKGKSWGVIRMKRFNMYGLDGGFGDNSEAKFIQKSLNEGWEVDAMPAMVDSLRSGSFARGNETALGGESVKTFYRMFQNVSISEDDCKNNNGFTYLIEKGSENRFIGLNAVKGTSHFMIDEENITSLVGTHVEIRTPMLCHTKAPNFCKVCCGKTLASRPEAVHIVTSDVGSAFMSKFMAAMHGSSLTLVDYDYTTAIS